MRLPHTMSTAASQGEIVVGLDIGTTKVCAVVAEVDGADGITILGVGTVPCRGLRKGIVANIDWTVRSIKDAIESAQTMAGVEIRTIYAGIGGSHIRSSASDGVAAIAGGEVTRSDVERVLEGARAIPVDADRQILHVLPREYMVDSQDGIRDPDRDGGRSPRREGQPRHRGDELRPERDPLRRARRASRSPTSCSSRSPAPRPSSATTRRRSASPSSTSAAARPTSCSTSTAGSRTRASSPSGATTSRATSPPASARRWPRPTGSSASRAAPSGAWWATTRRSKSRASAGTCPARRPAACSRDIIEPRVEEIFAVVRKRIEDTGMLEQLSAGVVLTGGAVLLQGMCEFAEEILGMPVRMGLPTGIKGITQLVHGPEYAAGVGLVKYGAQVTCEQSLLAGAGHRLGASARPHARALGVGDHRGAEVRFLGVDQGGVLSSRVRARSPTNRRREFGQ